MFFKTYQILFICILILGSLISVSANMWFTAWMGLEFNLMSMIPLILSKLNSNNTEAAIKYFLTQAMASIILIFSAIYENLPSQQMSLEALSTFITIALLIKLGAAPFHSWFPQITKIISWDLNILIMTWQKIAPFILLSAVISPFMLIVIPLTTLLGAMLGFNQLNMKLILTYSSISHTGWMIMASMVNIFYWTVYFFIYCTLSLSIILFFKSNALANLKKIFFCSDSTVNKIIIMMNILSLGGLPPLLGFTAKLSLIIVTFKLFYTILPFMIAGSLISLYFYSRVLYSSLMNKSFKNKISSFNKPYPTMFYFLTSLLNLGAPVLLLTT